MTAADPVLTEVPLPIRTPRLLLRGTQPGDGALTAAAVAETWDDLHDWMDWAKRREDNTAERAEIRTRQVMAKLILREEFNLLGIEIATGQPVIWCGFHGVDWRTRQCDTGYWVRTSAQGRGFATEATNALLRFAFGALGMRRVGLTHADGNERSRRVAEKLGFTPEGVQHAATLLPDGAVADKRLYARFDTADLPDLEVYWGAHAITENDVTDNLRTLLHQLEGRLLDSTVRRSPDAVASLLAEDFREFGSSGRVYGRAEMLEALANEVPSHLRQSDFACHQLSPEVALVTYRSYRHSPNASAESALRSSIWVRTDGRWRLRFHQGTRA